MPTLTSTTLGQFCRELAIQLSPLPVLLKEWGLTADDFAALQESAGYKHELTIIANEMRELGPDAGFVYRYKALSEIFIKDVVQIMNDVETPRSTKVELIKFAADMARVKEKPPTAAQQDLRASGPSVIFNFGAGLPIQSMRVLPEPIELKDVEPELALAQPKRGFGLDLNE